MTHDLSNLEVYDELLLTLLGQPQPYDAIVCTTHCAEGVMQRLFDAVSHVIPNTARLQFPVIPLGIDTTWLTPMPQAAARHQWEIPPGKPVLLYLGRLSHRMKADLLPLLQAFVKIREVHPALLVIAGSITSPEEERSVARLKRRCVELGLAEHVQLHINIAPERKPSLLSAADLLVSPADSLQESFGVVLLEAMACALPVIASDWNGYREVLSVPDTGLLIETTMPEKLCDVSSRAPLEMKSWWYSEYSQAVSVSIEQLVRAILVLLGDPDRRKEMGKAGRRRVCQYFDWAHIISSYERVWERLIETAQGSAPVPVSPYWYSHTGIFAEHASRRLSPKALIQRTASAQAPGLLVQEPPAFLNPALLKQILQTVAQPTPIDTLGDEQGAMLRHVAYLLKHGLVREMPPTTS